VEMEKDIQDMKSKKKMDKLISLLLIQDLASLSSQNIPTLKISMATLVEVNKFLLIQKLSQFWNPKQKFLSPLLIEWNHWPLSLKQLLPLTQLLKKFTFFFLLLSFLSFCSLFNKFFILWNRKSDLMVNSLKNLLFMKLIQKQNLKSSKIYTQALML